MMALPDMFGSAAPRVLIVRLSSIGDVIHGLPVLTALRDRFPDAFLCWLVERRAAALLEGHAALNDLLIVQRGWLKSPRQVLRTANQLRALDFDIAIDLQGLTKSALAARLSGAPRRIGFGGDKGRELSRWFYTERVVSTARHIIDCNLELLRPLDIVDPQVRFDLPERQGDRAMAEAITARLGLHSGFAMLNPGAGWPSKLWPAERYAAVARHLHAEHHLPSLVVWAGAEEEQWAQQIVRQSRGAARLAPSTTLGGLASLARRAMLFVGSDTGPLHLAAAVGTPCVGLYGPMPAERNGPYGPQHVAIQEMSFQGSSRQRRTAPAALMEAISAQRVCEACDQILARSAQRDAA